MVTLYTTAGPPLPPVPVLEELNATTLRLWWEEPFTWSKFPILSYTVSVRNSSSGTIIANTTTEARRREVLFTNTIGISKKCWELSFLVKAASAVGESKATSVLGGFPISKRFILREILQASSLECFDFVVR